MSVGSRETDNRATTIGEIRPVATQAIKGGSSKAMTKEDKVSKATTPTGNNKTGEIIISRHKIGVTITRRSKTGVITTNLRNEGKVIRVPNKTARITLTSNVATGPKTSYHKGLRKTGVVSNHSRKEEMIKSNGYTTQRRCKLSAFLNIASTVLRQRSKKQY